MKQFFAYEMSLQSCKMTNFTIVYETDFYCVMNSILLEAM